MGAVLDSAARMAAWDSEDRPGAAAALRAGKVRAAGGQAAPRASRQLGPQPGVRWPGIGHDPVGYASEPGWSAMPGRDGYVPGMRAGWSAGEPECEAAPWSGRDPREWGAPERGGTAHR